MINRRRNSQRLLVKQKGSVLLWGLIILITLTVVGVTAARVGVTDTRIASNQIFSVMTYQGAESALERVTQLFHIQQAATAASRTASRSYVDSVNNNVQSLNSTGLITMREPMMCVAQNGYAMSVEMTPDLGGITCRLFIVEARANLAGTGASSEHVQGIMKYVPADGSTVN